jgi:hypothetical protein
MAKITRGTRGWTTPSIDRAAATEGYTGYTVKYTAANPNLSAKYPAHKGHAQGGLDNEHNMKVWKTRKSAEQWIKKFGAGLTRNGGTLEVIEAEG